jgi:hypothetical protein
VAWPRFLLVEFTTVFYFRERAQLVRLPVRAPRSDFSRGAVCRPAEQSRAARDSVFLLAARELLSSVVASGLWFCRRGLSFPARSLCPVMDSRSPVLSPLLVFLSCARDRA